MHKSELRTIYKAKRLQVSAASIADFSIQIANQALQIPIWDLSFYHLFLSISKNKEVDTAPLLSVLQGKDKHVVVSKTLAHGELGHFLLTDQTRLVLNRLQIPEPENGIAVEESQIDVVFVPLLAFDKRGNRVGYGQGYYDRFLAQCRGDVVKIGLSFFEAEEVISGLNEDDVALDYCITPKKVYSF
ncbi:5-formyltetrahydrofolate cyclo-ligase [Flagellimonas sp. DF-77]|uniref:5-formyltetrahydrofolate cyclo-ligase n=1 Tax=Flagellimonas algarum TaxID=3230298 RepID=UPI0033929EBA